MWTMLMSDGATYEPIWLYVELYLNKYEISPDSDNFLNMFNIQIGLHQATQVPLSIIAYQENLNYFIVYEYHNGFSKSYMDKQQNWLADNAS